MTHDAPGPHPSSPTYAAVDLGSNSFHMVVARLADGVPERLDRIRERVRLAGGLDARSHLGEQAVERAVACLKRFNQRLRDIPPSQVRAVGTNTLRKARNSHEFLPRLRDALGHPIEIISGAEEARLVYLGVSHSVETASGPRLVVDIGGGSTECVIGEEFEARSAHSFHMGCVNFTRRFFPGGEIDRRRWDQAVDAAHLELQPVRRRVRQAGIQEAYGSSGTIKAIGTILGESGWTDGSITKRGLKELRDRVVVSGNSGAIDLPGLRDDRRPVLPGGAAVLYAVFTAFRLEAMRPAAGALREGVLYDLLGRLQEEDVRERTISTFEQRFQIDVEQGKRVARLAHRLFDQCRHAWKLPEDAWHQLSWAARLHELGLFVSYSRSHVHGAYLVRNAEMPGFSRQEQEMLAGLISNARRGFDPSAFSDLLPEQQRVAPLLAILLRLAVRLARSRTDESLPPAMRLAVSNATLSLGIPGTWLDENPLTRLDMEHERGRLEPSGFALELVEV